MVETVNRKTVGREFSIIYGRIYDRILESGRPISDEDIHAEAIAEIREKYSENEIATALLYPVAEAKWKEQTKGHSISSILAKAKQGDAFPVELEEANINLDGITVPFVAAKQDIINQQIRHWIDHDLKWKKAYARNMDTMLPIQSLMEEQNCTAGEAMNILRQRN